MEQFPDYPRTHITEGQAPGVAPQWASRAWILWFASVAKALRGIVLRLLPGGGSAGQALLKASGSDYDVRWGDVSAPAGDAILDGGGAKTDGDAAKFNADGKLVDAGAPAILDGGGAKTSGNAGVFNASGKLADAGAAPVLFGGGSKTAGDAVVFDGSGKAVDAGAAPLLKTSGAWSVGFLIGWSGGASTGNDLAGHRPLPVACTPVKLLARCATGPVTSDQTITIKRWRAGVGTSILTAPLTITAGTEYADTTAFDLAVTLAAGDYLTIDSAQSGGTPAVSVFVELLLN